MVNKEHKKQYIKEFSQCVLLDDASTAMLYWHSLGGYKGGEKSSDFGIKSYFGKHS